MLLEDCILDRLNPTWINRAVNFSENTAFHLARLSTSRGAASNAASASGPASANIPLGKLNRKLAREVREQDGFEPTRSGGEAVPVRLQSR